MHAQFPGTNASLAESNAFKQRLSIYAHLIFHLQKGVLLNDNLKLNCINFPLIAYLILNELTGTSLPYLHVELISTAKILANTKADGVKGLSPACYPFMQVLDTHHLHPKKGADALALQRRAFMGFHSVTAFGPTLTLGSWLLVLCSLKPCWRKAHGSCQACQTHDTWLPSAGVGLCELMSHHSSLLVSMASCWLWGWSSL